MVFHTFKEKIKITFWRYFEETLIEKYNQILDLGLLTRIVKYHKQYNIFHNYTNVSY